MKKETMYMKLRNAKLKRCKYCPVLKIAKELLNYNE